MWAEDLSDLEVSDDCVPLFLCFGSLVFVHGTVVYSHKMFASDFVKDLHREENDFQIGTLGSFCLRIVGNIENSLVTRFLLHMKTPKIRKRLKA